jgi:hypothetical protein
VAIGGMAGAPDTTVDLGSPDEHVARVRALRDAVDALLRHPHAAAR